MRNNDIIYSDQKNISKKLDLIINNNKSYQNMMFFGIMIFKNENLNNIYKMKYKIIDNFLNQKCFDYLYSLKLKEVGPSEISVQHNKIYNNGKIIS